MGIHDMRPSSTVKIFAAGLMGLALGISSPAFAAGDAPAASGSTRGEGDLLVVDCLLPQKMRRLGRNNTYLAPRQPIRTIAADCRVRGGEYTEPDQANYATSLKVWLPQAEAGDAEAMYYVGQIYEKGLGTPPDYAKAAEWYRQAGEKGYGPAAVNLGSLYEQGLGVEKNEVEALNWYRKSAGLSSDLVVLEAAEYESLQKAKAELEAKKGELDALKREIEELHRQISAVEKDSEAGRQRQATLESLVKRMQGELAAKENELVAGRDRVARLEQQASASGAGAPASAVAAAAVAGDPVKTSFKEIPFGQYHALVIGNQSYAQLPALEGAEGEAREVAALLEKKYGFKVRLLVNATRVDILEALNDYREKLTRKDNFLVYYAGHGQRDAAGQTAYWQPVDADPAKSSRWLPSGVLTEHLDLIAANHVFVVANSVFAGLRTRSSVARLPRGMSDEDRYYHIKLLMEKRARLVLSSGAEGNAAAAAPSVGKGFAGAFVDALRQNDGVLEASALYQKVNDRLQGQQTGGGVEFAAMKWARNDLADFFFVPATLR
jgi:uncharacterized protein